MRRALALLTALCLALGPAGCGRRGPGPEDSLSEPSYLAAGMEAAAREDWAGAIDAYARAIEAGEDRAAAYAGRGDCYLALARAGETEPGPDLEDMARRDYERALALDPALGARVSKVYADLAGEALDAGDAERAMNCLALAGRAAPETEDSLRERMLQLTDELLPGSVWYMDAPESRYYLFSAGGKGRIVDAASMEPAGAFSYENEGFSITLTEGGESRQWTYDPDRACYETPGTWGERELTLRLGRTTARRLYGQWQADILAREARLRADRTLDSDPSAGYEYLYEREYALLEELAGSAERLTRKEKASLEAEQERRTALGEGETTAREAFQALRQTVGELLRRLPDADGAVSGPVLGEIFPVGEQTLLDYLRQSVVWALNGKGLTVSGGAEALTGWRSLADVEHCFRDGRLYLRLDGYVLREEPEPRLVLDENGRFEFPLPLTVGDDASASDGDLLARLQEESWTGLWTSPYGGGTDFLELTLEPDMTCTARGGGYPGGTAGVQSGTYALEGRELTLTLAAEGYAPGTYRYQALPMGESLYMTLLTEGPVYGQKTGDTCVFCAGGYANAWVEER